VYNYIYALIAKARKAMTILSPDDLFGKN